MKKLIAVLRADERTAQVKVLVGGLPFNVDSSLWRQVGADGSAPDATSALLEADRLIAESKAERQEETSHSRRRSDGVAEGGHEFGS
ncbi:hypothetical protein [Saccharibacillus sp. JS10]|uniref:hypothetical protein n=1 Tax=Saccharibacillus sp. JS10 TaxID=2950552 RepID=UPI00210928D7|nr:hypothetical protein [Saccharibacillus sp. JS10]MCQ4087129.1 hypothetical protein [Saccharibacillus sp. JS10]